MAVIGFTSHLIDFKLKNKKKLADWIQKVVLANKKYPVRIVYIFCDDDYLSEMNVKYLKHKTLTDIITFNYNAGYQVSGDIFISIERVRENSLKYKTSFENELHRVMIHGVLHLLGYNDKSEFQKKKMVRKENESLALLLI